MREKRKRYLNSSNDSGSQECESQTSRKRLKQQDVFGAEPVAFGTANVELEDDEVLEDG